MIIAVYLITFAAGPLAFWALARRPADKSYFAQLAVLVITLLAFAVIIPRGAGEAWLTWVYFGVIMLAVLWLAWITVLAMCVLAIRRRFGPGIVTRWAFVVGAVATTLPWFGLNLAQYVAD